MTRLDKIEFICVDCETTGLEPSEARIIEVGAVRFTLDAILEQYESLVDPQCTIPESSIAIHHITQEMVSGKPTIKQILPQLLSFIGKGIIIGHGIPLDIEFISKAAEWNGITCNLRQNTLIDTLRLGRLYGETQFNSLESLRQHFNIPTDGAHRAMSDVMVNIGVFKHLVRGYKTLPELLDILSKPIAMKTMPLGKYKGRLIKELPLEYLLYSARLNFDKDLLFSLRSEINRRKKGNLFHQAANPFSEL